MKKISLIAILSLVSSFAFADTVYYPNNKYLVDGTVSFINTNSRPKWNDTDMVIETDLSDITQDVSDLKDATNYLDTAVTTLNNATNSLNGRVDNLEITTNALDQAVSALNAATNDLNTRVESIESSYVKSINNENGDITITEDEDIKIKTDGNTITIKTQYAAERSYYEYRYATDGEVPVYVEKDWAEQAYNWESGISDTTVTLMLPTASDSKLGYLNLYLYTDDENNNHYDLDDETNVEGMPSVHFWTESEGGVSVWKIELESIPYSTKWYFKKATEFDISLPPARAETVFTLEGGTEQTYNISGTLDRQWLIDNNLLDEESGEWLVTITSANIGTNVTSIEEEAFYGCNSLTNVTIPDNVTDIGGGAFGNCSGLTSVTIGNSVVSIGWQAFSGCTGLTTLAIPDSVTSIERYAFEGCSGLTSVTMAGRTASTVQGMDNYSWDLPSGCVITCSDSTITIP